jgi:hypothetical protein
MPTLTASIVFFFQPKHYKDRSIFMVCQPLSLTITKFKAAVVPTEVSANTLALQHRKQLYHKAIGLRQCHYSAVRTEPDITQTQRCGPLRRDC